ncbi:MAG: Gx transporter family protein [Defluviitaleaceae bacterium]|nr:Gx transporter family protein [Defluviitaleaceae bacterium]
MSTRKLAFMGIMLAAVLVLSVVESMLQLPFLPPQFGRVGVSNVVIMYLAFFVGKKEAALMVCLKALFSLLTRGFIAGLLSLSGGLFSIFVIFALWWIIKKEKSYVALSISGAIAHNIGQLFVACILLGHWGLFVFYFPVLLITGTIFGTITAIFLKILITRLEKGEWKP